MQFFKALLKLNDLYYSDQRTAQDNIRRLNTKYWIDTVYPEIHVLMSRISYGQATIIVMYEQIEAEIKTIDRVCQKYIEDLCKESGIDKISWNKEKLIISEITLSTFCELFSEEWLDKMYEDKPAIMNILRIDNSKFICSEDLLEPLIGGKKYIRRYIPEEELARIRNSRIKSGEVTYQPVHYIVIENDSNIRNLIDDELVYELRKSGRITSRRCIRLSSDNMFQLQRHGNKIQNLNNLDGGVVFVNVNDCSPEELKNLTRAVYTETNNYSGKYAVIFHVCEGNDHFIEEIKASCNLWPFICIYNKRLERNAAIKQFLEVARNNQVELSRKECAGILKGQNDYSYDEINELFRKWFLTDYSVKIYHPQYKKTIDEYYSNGTDGKDALKELEELIGLDDVKALCKRIITFFEYQKLRKNQISEDNEIGMHMVFTGNPGTAKTTVARLVAKILKQKGILSKDELVEVGRADLVGKYVGWTARIVRDYFNQAKGSVLFIDEAYSLVDKDNSFGAEAINTIVQEMENHRNDVVVIFAGYKKEMSDFISMNSGLKSRVSFFVDFPDYTSSELYEILEHFAKKNHYSLNEDVHDEFINVIENLDTTCGNGRLVRNEFEKARMRQAERIMSMPKNKRKNEMAILIGQDFRGDIA